MSRRIFCDTCRCQRWLDVEVSLARCQAELGIVPASAAAGIAEAATFDRLDAEAVQELIGRTGHSLVGLLEQLRDACAGQSGHYVHYGATTQDIQDTAQSLEMREVLDVLEDQLRAIIENLTGLAKEHAATAGLGRTHARPALPIGYGLKFAGWVDELLRDLERLTEMRPRVLVVQLFGGVGTMAAFGLQGPELLCRFADRLGLAAPAMSWHTTRDRVAEYVTTLAAVTGTLGRVADEVRTLSQPEFGELDEPLDPRHIGSSTMPHKRNPERCEQVVVLARLAVGEASTALTGLGGNHERDARSLRLEWACVPGVSHDVLTAAKLVQEITAGLVVHRQRITANLTAVADQVSSERLMFEVARQVGLGSAHRLVAGVVAQARETGRPLRTILTERPELGLDAAGVDEVLNVTSYLGSSVDLVNAVLARAESCLRRLRRE